MHEKINKLLSEINTLVADTAIEAEELRIKYLGKKGVITGLFDEFRNFPSQEKKEIGMILNRLKNEAHEKIKNLKEHFDKNSDKTTDIDWTLPGTSFPIGTRHPLSIVKNQIIDIFARLGFTVAEGPEIEDDLHVFSALNFPPEHPARDMQDTFFISKDPDVLLRTHTSSVQVRLVIL